VNASSASPTSLRCQWRTFVASRSMPAATSASAAKYAACRSRATTCVAHGLGFEAERAERALLDLRRQVRVRPDGAGDLAHGDLARAALESRAPARAISAWCPASARPKVIGSAKMPWLRPIIGVFACSRARLASARAACRSARRASAASRSRIASDVSRTSLDVIPRCSQRASMPGELLDVREERDDVVLGRALDLVDAAGVENEASCRESRRRPARDEARLLHRLAAASSTSSHTAKRRAGDQSSAKSAGV
jgi:hypothetical protein